MLSNLRSVKAVQRFNTRKISPVDPSATHFSMFPIRARSSNSNPSKYCVVTLSGGWSFERAERTESSRHCRIVNSFWFFGEMRLYVSNLTIYRRSFQQVFPMLSISVSRGRRMRQAHQLLLMEIQIQMGHHIVQPALQRLPLQ